MNTDRRERPDASGNESERNERKRGGDRTEERTASRADDGRDTRTRSDDEDRDRGRRDVILPRELYKIVTVFSTLIAIVAVVSGFVLLDMATNRTSAAASDVNLPLAIGGVGLIVLGAATYAFAARFRTRGMGSPNNDADGGSGNG